MLFLLRLKDFRAGTWQIQFALRIPLRSTKLLQLIYTGAACVCALRVCVCKRDWELAAAGRAKRVCKVTAVVLMQPQAGRLTKRGEGKQAWQMYLMHTRHTCHTYTHTLAPAPPTCCFFTTLCCAPAAGRAIKTVARFTTMPAGCSYYRLFKLSTDSQSNPFPALGTPLVMAIT